MTRTHRLRPSVRLGARGVTSALYFMPRKKKTDYNFIWQVVGLVILGLGLLARNSIVILAGFILFFIFWYVGRKVRKGKKLEYKENQTKKDKKEKEETERKRNKERKTETKKQTLRRGSLDATRDKSGQENKETKDDEAGDANRVSEAKGKVSGPAEIEEPDEFNLEEELDHWDRDA